MYGEKTSQSLTLLQSAKSQPRKNTNKDKIIKTYKHNNIARIVSLELCQKFGLIGEVRWYNHRPVSVVKNDRVKILWGFNIQTDHVIQHRRP